jgi:hypothetical protein
MLSSLAHSGSKIAALEHPCNRHHHPASRLASCRISLARVRKIATSRLNCALGVQIDYYSSTAVPQAIHGRAILALSMEHDNNLM